MVGYLIWSTFALRIALPFSERRVLLVYLAAYFLLPRNVLPRVFFLLFYGNSIQDALIKLQIRPVLHPSLVALDGVVRDL